MIAIGGWTIDQILFWEADKFAGFTEMLAFQGSSGTEGPAWSALTLVLDGGHGTTGTPIHVFGEFNIGGGDVVSASEAGGLLQIHSVSVHQSGEFVRQEVTVVVHFQFVGVMSQMEAGVVLGNSFLVLHEDFHTEFFFLGVGVVFSCKVENLEFEYFMNYFYILK